MARIVVAGLINIETTLAVDRFPVEYEAVRYPFFGVRTTVSGVGLNIAKALKTLGDEVVFLSLIGRDAAGDLVLQELQSLGIASGMVHRDLDETPQSAILYDPDGRRAIFTDLKDIQDRTFPRDEFRKAADGAAMAVLCNINFTRGLLPVAKYLGIPVATDVHAISSLDDEYNRDYMGAADYLAFSHENLPSTPERFAASARERYGNRAILTGCGKDGALLWRKGHAALRQPAVTPRKVVNTIGAGDALFASFVHFVANGRSEEEAIELAVFFAGWKIGERGASEGFLSEAKLEELAGKS